MFTGKKITLRPFRAEDAPESLALRHDVAANKALVAYPYPVNLENEKNWIGKLYGEKEPGAIFMVIEENTSTSFAGYISIKNINRIHRNGDFGVILGERFRGKGYASEAMRLFFRYLFDDLNLHKIKLEVLEENVPAIRAYEKIGFVREGMLQEHIWQDGKFKNLIVMSLFASKFVEK